MSTRRKVTIGLTSTFLIATAAFWLIGDRKRDNHLSLLFHRYSNVDAYVGDVAFFWLTNASTNIFLFSTPNAINPHVIDTSFGRHTDSWLLNCEFNDHTPHGWTNWIQQPSLVRSSNSYVYLASYSAILIRIPLPPNGQRRRVAALYQEIPHPTTFWVSPVGLRLYRLMPKWIKHRILEAPLRRVWCDREILSEPPPN